MLWNLRIIEDVTNGGKKGRINMMIDEDKKEEYKKVTEVLVRSDRKMSAVRRFFVRDNKDMWCSDDALRHDISCIEGITESL